MAYFGTSDSAPTGGGYLNPIARPSLPVARPPAPVRAPINANPYNPPPRPISTTQLFQPLRSIGPAYSGPSGTMNSTTTQSATGFAATGSSAGTQALDMGASQPSGVTAPSGGGFDMSNIPRYVWVAIALGVFFILAQPRELHIKA